MTLKCRGALTLGFTQPTALVLLYIFNVREASFEKRVIFKPMGRDKV